MDLFIAQFFIYSLIASGSALLGFIFRYIILYQMEENKIRFTKLHMKRAEVIEELYSKLVEFSTKMRDLINPLQPGKLPTKEDIQRVSEMGNDFVNFCLKKRIFFNSITNKLIDNLNKEIFKSYLDYTAYPDDDKSNGRFELWRNSWTRISEDVPKLTEQIENEFKIILGVRE